jgi:beta-lactamase regulating signal transducer with metallopeptidase domain
MDDELLQLGSLMWRASWQGAILAVVVLALIALLGRWLTPAWRYGLWLVVLARLALPVVPTASWSVWRLTDAIPVNASIATPVVATSENAFYKQEFVSAINQQVPVTDLFTAATQPFNWTMTMMWLWLFGSIVGISWFTITWLRLRRQISASSAIVDPRVEATLISAAKTAGLSRVPSLREIPTIAGPAAFGVLHPVILLPQGLAEHLSDQELNDALLHECTHLRRHDVAAVWLATATLCLHWWNPIAWMSLRRLRAAQEIACDAAVLRLTAPNQHHHYATSIVRLAAFAAGLPHHHLTARASGARRELLERITMIHHPTTPTRRLLTTGALLTMTMAGLVLLDAPPRIVSAEPQPITPVTTPQPNDDVHAKVPPQTPKPTLVNPTSKPFLGVTVDENGANFDPNQGLPVNTVIPGSTAATIGIEVGDLLLTFNGAKLTSLDELNAAIGKIKVDDEISIELTRKIFNKLMKKTVKGPISVRPQVASIDMARLREEELTLRRLQEERKFELENVKPAKKEAPAKFISGVVAAVRLNPQGQQDLVMLTLAKGDQVEAGVEFTISRGNEYIVRVRVEKTMGDMAACRVIQDSWNENRNQIQKDDQATNTLATAKRAQIISFTDDVTEAERESVMKRLQQRVDLILNGTNGTKSAQLDEILQPLFALTGLSYTIAGEGLRQEILTIHLVDESLETALSAIARLLNLRYDYTNGILHVMTKEIPSNNIKTVDG